MQFRRSLRVILQKRQRERASLPWAISRMGRVRAGHVYVGHTVESAFFFFLGISNSFPFQFLSSICIININLYRCPKIVKLILLGS
jgi:hypothetical protein